MLVLDSRIRSQLREKSGISDGLISIGISKAVIEYLARAVEFAAALIIAVAAARATWQSLRLLFASDEPPEAKVAVRLTLGRWLAVALEFELAADV